MFERFTERSRQVIVFAQTAVREEERDRIDSYALILGLIDEGEGVAARVLKESLPREKVFSQWARADKEYCAALDQQGEEQRGGSNQTPFTGVVQKTLETALREALALGHNYIGTEHILLASLRVSKEIYEELGLNTEIIRNEVIRYLSGAKSLKNRFWVWTETTKNAPIVISANDAQQAAERYAIDMSHTQGDIFVSESTLRFEISLWAKEKEGGSNVIFR